MPVNVLQSDVTDSTGADTLTDITGLAFPAFLSDTRLWFRFVIAFTSAATTTGARFTINGAPTTAPTYLSYNVRVPTTATEGSDSFQENADVLYDGTPSAATATVAFTTGNTATIEGIIIPSVDAIITGRFASEVAGSAITVKAGSFVHWRKL